MPQVSVIIPVFNRDPTKAMLSVQAQTFRDWECLVVDDGSSSSYDIKHAVEALGDPRFRYVRRENGGESAARNTGIDAAEADFVAFLDSDDEWIPDKLEREAPERASGAVLFSQVIAEKNGNRSAPHPFRGPAQDENFAEYLFCHEGFSAPSSTSLPTELARKVRWDEAVKFGADSAFAVRLMNAGAKFRMSEVPLVVMDDNETGDRQSRLTDWRATKVWLDRIRPVITPRAYRCYLGWHIARQAAHSGDYVTALRFYAFGVTAMPNRLKVKALREVVSPRHLLRTLLRRNHVHRAT